MPNGAQPVGRRERNKRDKLERIIAAARELFNGYGVDAVTTQQIADKADIGSKPSCSTVYRSSSAMTWRGSWSR